MKKVILGLTLVSLAGALVGCGNDLVGKSEEYKRVHQEEYWKRLNGGGGMSGDAQAWANLHAHTAAEEKVGK